MLNAPLDRGGGLSVGEGQGFDAPQLPFQFFGAAACIGMVATEARSEQCSSLVRWFG